MEGEKVLTESENDFGFEIISEDLSFIKPSLSFDLTIYDADKPPVAIKNYCRAGVPREYRAYVWLSVIGLHVEDTFEKSLQKMETIYKSAIQATFGHKNVEAVDVVAKNVQFGTNVNLSVFALSENQLGSFHRVVHILKEMFLVEFCPLLPTLAAVLVRILPESSAYTVLREIVKQTEVCVFFFY